MMCERLVDCLRIKNYWASVRTLILVISNTILHCLLQTSLLYIKKSCDLIKAGNLRFVPTYGPLPEFSEDLHKNLVSLSQTIYWANYMFLMYRGPNPGATTDLEQEFRRELPVGDITSIILCINLIFSPQQAYPILFEICPLTMRTQGILLVRDTTLLLGILPTDGESYASTSSVGSIWGGLTLLPPDDTLALWRQSFDQISALLDEFSRKLLGNIKRFREYGGTSAADMITSSCIACLAHLAILYEVACRTDPAAREMYDVCDSALRKLGVLTSELYLEEYTHFDLLLGVRPSPHRFPMAVAQPKTGIVFLGEVTISLRRSHKKSPPRRERITAAFPQGGWRKAFRFPSQAPPLPAAADVRFGYVGGRYHGGFEVSKPDVARGEGGVWGMI